MRVLIVDDDFLSRKKLQEILAPYGKTDAAVNGAEAMEAFKLASSEGTPYDLVCLDMIMPGMDGHEVLNKIRSYEDSIGKIAFDASKIIMTTSRDDFENIERAFSEQCDGYLLKPVSEEKLLETMKHLKLV